MAGHWAISRRHVDVGSPKIAGYATYNAASQVYTLSAGGVNIWAKRDEFQFAYRRMKGDFIVQAQVEFQGKGVDPHRKAGIMVRTSIADFDSAYVDGALHGDGLTSLQYRKAKGEDTAQTEMAAAKGANVIQLERRGNVFIFSAARFGEPFEVAEIKDVPNVPEEAYVGLFLSSHNPDVKETVIFRQRARDQTGEGRLPALSRLHRLAARDAERRRTVIARRCIRHACLSRRPTGCPMAQRSSTTPAAAIRPRADGCGSSTSPRARRRSSTPASRSATTTITCCRSTARSSRSATRARTTTSRLSTRMPTSGGVPKRITPLTPSYMHGWSPDAKWLMYTGGRAPKEDPRTIEYDIYKIASDGSGKEINLTNTAGLDDGPEYSPDGQWIYFNSTRSGQMQIWRMKPDGTNQERVTNDHKFNDWFPHFSPDGKWIAIISYGLDVAASDHPYYKHCYLRLMPTDGSAPPKVIAYVYGGQGTINVPSWSPDGTHIAFVSNSDAL